MSVRLEGDVFRQTCSAARFIGWISERHQKSSHKLPPDESGERGTTDRSGGKTLVWRARVSQTQPKVLIYLTQRNDCADASVIKLETAAKLDSFFYLTVRRPVGYLHQSGLVTIEIRLPKWPCAPIAIWRHDGTGNPDATIPGRLSIGELDRCQNQISMPRTMSVQSRVAK